MRLQPLRAFLWLLFVPLAGYAFEADPYVEVLIPNGMPIKIEVQRDQRDPEILKYVFRRIVPKDVARAKITVVMLGDDGAIKFQSPMAGDALSDQMTVATVDASVTRLLVVVNWVETNQGRWVPDTKNQQLDIGELIRCGAKGLPKAKFISHKPTA
ncbi:MAG TPA: hypothetical protein VJ464_07000 [Blastocatellia bacterium]|nr:hypothetical protein [Blastocatellia bacterium]